MSKIAIRVPNYVTNSADTSKDLTVEISIYDLEGSIPAAPQYVIQKKKYDINVSEVLSVNISRFIKDYFELTAYASFAGSINEIKMYGILRAAVKVNGVTSNFECFYGYEVAEDAAVYSADTVKNTFLGSTAGITGDLTGMNQVKWTTDNGLSYTAAFTNGFINAREFSILNGNLTFTNSKTVTVTGSLSDAAPTWSRTYNIECPYEQGVTMKFINEFGLWESIDYIGRVKEIPRVTSKEYLSLADGARSQFLKQGKKQFRANTGAVDESFNSVLEALLLSEDVVVIIDGAAVPVKILSNSIKMKSDKADLGFSYEITYELAKPLIRIV